ncbi:uncharacterized protein RJT21DRAFT_26005 [Scheffersomyces amazonensis]|uniref:uncharacterized protein n=1 Tax=Scheffersomyces amazonensis TaxID=1078765 RepID=UPI00315D60B2
MEVSPGVLEFTGTFTKQTTEYLSLSNSTATPLAFKVKTTAPKLYCVRPNASIINPGDSLKIAIILQGFSQPLPKDYKCKDKFLLVSLPCPQLTDASKVGESWASLESEFKSEVVSKKLRVVYNVTDQDVPEPSSNGVEETHEPASVVSQRRPVEEPVKVTPNHGTSSGVEAAGAAVAAAGIAAATQSHKSPAQEDIQKELNDSRAPVHNLNEKLDSNEKFGSQPPPQPQGQGQGQSPGYGYPPQSPGYGYPPAPGYGYPPPVHQQPPPPPDAYVRRSSSVTSIPGGEVKAINAEPVNGISLPMAALLMLVAFLIGWLVF